MPHQDAGLIRGRVLNVDGSAVVLQVCGGELTVKMARDASGLLPGDLVQGVWPEPISFERIMPHPTGEFPKALDESARFLAPETWSRLKARARIMSKTRGFFEAQEFLEVETPMVVQSPGTEVHLQATEVYQSAAPGQKPQKRWLITSPEYHMKRLLVGGSPPIFQISKVFRDGERGINHRPEFTMLEWYRPWSSTDALMNDCEALLRELAGSSSLNYQGTSIDLKAPWRRLSFYDALRERGGINDPTMLSTEEQLHVLVARIEPTLGKDAPEFLTDYPKEMASLARLNPEDPRFAERFELYIAGLELGNAFGELTDPNEQRRRCESENIERNALGYPTYPLDEAFLGALQEGMPPSAGIAVGMDRLVMLLTDTCSIDDVVTF